MSNLRRSLSPLRTRLRRYWATDLILLLVVGLVVWVVIGDLSGTKEKGEAKEGPGAIATATVTASEIGKRDWKVGAIQAVQNAQVYEVTIVGKGGEPLFRFKVDAFQAQPLGKGDKQLEGVSRLVPESMAPLPPETVGESVTALLPQLEAGVATRRGREPFFKVPIMFGELRIAEVRLDAATNRVISLEKKPPQTEEREGGEDENERGGKGKIVSKNLVLPLGYLAALVAIVSALYYSWKRSLYAPIRAVSGEAKAKAAAGLRQTLRVHMLAGVVALALAAMHVLNFTHRVRLNISWLTLAMMVTVAASGVFGKYFARTEVIRHHWRRFHVPYTVLFFLVLLLHVLMKIGVLED